MPSHIISALKSNGAEIVPINNSKGGIASMFWRYACLDVHLCERGGAWKTHLLTNKQKHVNPNRFMVADDNTVDRWIVRDSDSRLNPRERFTAPSHTHFHAHTHVMA